MKIDETKKYQRSQTSKHSMACIQTITLSLLIAIFVFLLCPAAKQTITPKSKWENLRRSITKIHTSY